MGAHSNLIDDVSQRTNRKEAKQSAVLRFLGQQLWSTQNILQLVMGLQSRQAAHKSLKQMELAELVHSYQYKALGGDITLWGITPHGQGMAFDLTHEMPCKAYFEPSRISEQNIRHQLDLQMMRVKAEKSGWYGWRDGDRLGALDKSVKRPDALVKSPEGQVIAIELERTFKTTKRYDQILLSYLKLLKAEKISKVIWILPTQDMANRLKAIITGIKQITISGQKIPVDPAKHHVNLGFISYEDWPSK